MIQEKSTPRPTAGTKAILAASLSALWAVTAAGWASAQEAPATAPRASPAQRQLAAAEAALERLAALEQEWQERAGADDAVVAVRLEEVTAMEARLAEAEAGSDATSAVFDRSKELTRDAVADLRAVLHHAEGPSEVPEPRRRGAARLNAFASSDRPANGAEAERLEELESQLKAKTLQLLAREIELRQESIDRHGTYSGRLWRLRLAALEVLPAARADLLSSLSRERWAEIRFDFDVVRLVLELQWFRLCLLIYSLPYKVRDVFAAATAGGALFRIILVVLLWRWVQGRRPRILERLRQRAGGLGRARVVAELIEAAAPWGIFLLALLALHWALGPELLKLPFLGAVVFVLGAIYGAYRLAADLGVAVLVAGAEHTAFEITEERQARIDRSLRRVLRVALVIFLLPVAYRYRLEGGVLHEALREIGLWVVLAAALVALAVWREELADACLAMKASGRWADLLRRSRQRNLGYLLAPLAFLWLAGRGLWALSHEVASGYARTRLATTYLARRRIEKEAAERGYAEVDLPALPEGLAEALDERLRPGDAAALEQIPGLDEARRSVAEWRQGKGGGAFLLAGEQGIGKRAWVDRFCALEPGAARLTLDRRLQEPAELISWLGRGLLGEGELTAGCEELAQKLGAGDRRIVVIEGAENLFLARVDGYRALAEMAALAGATRLEVFWLLAMEGLAFNHLRATSKELTALGRVAVLPDWPEPRIRELLRHRLAAGGFTASYVELLGELGSGEDAEARGREGEKAYGSLLADFAGGNPRLALHYFLRSLVPGEDGELKVRPFRPPPEDQLAELGDEAHFLLAAVARHGSLTSDQASAVTGYRSSLAGILLTRLCDLEVLAAEGDRYRVSSHWQSTVFRLLRRRNVLVS